MSKSTVVIEYTLSWTDGDCAGLCFEATTGGEIENDCTATKQVAELFQKSVEDFLMDAMSEEE